MRNLALKNLFKKGLKAENLIEVLPYLLLVGIFVVFAILYPPFSRIRNITGILTVSSVFLLVAAGETFPILMGSIDLSVGAMLSSCAIVAAYFFPQGGLGMIVLAIVVGFLSGLVNGLLVVLLKLPSFIVTLAMMYVYVGIATGLTNGYNISIRNRDFAWISTGQMIEGIPNVIIWSLIVFAVFVFISRKTVVGRYILAIGSNEESVKKMGINTNKYRIIAFTFSGLLVGIASVLLSSYLGMAPARLGDKYLFNTLIAVVVGGTSIMGGSGGLLKTLIGVLLISMFDNGMSLIGSTSNVQNIAKGILLIAAISLVMLPHRRGRLLLTK
ncbi:ABC transporter permease [Mesotoga prima]|uniref:ABC transporter permease n=1 Tax=Mesotoga prima TaxID=1184387 RepID=UPI002FDA2FAE